MWKQTPWTPCDLKFFKASPPLATTSCLAELPNMWTQQQQKCFSALNLALNPHFIMANDNGHKQQPTTIAIATINHDWPKQQINNHCELSWRLSWPCSQFVVGCFVLNISFTFFLLTIFHNLNDLPESTRNNFEIPIHELSSVHVTFCHWKLVRLGTSCFLDSFLWGYTMTLKRHYNPQTWLQFCATITE